VRGRGNEREGDEHVGGSAHNENGNLTTKHYPYLLSSA